MSILTEVQEKRHIYLTNQNCNNCDHVDRRHLTEFGLSHGWWNGKKVLTNTNANSDDASPKGCVFYPLTAEERIFINEHGFLTGEGYVGLTGYSTLYKGKKWLSPIIEIEWYTEEKARYGYKPEYIAPTQDQAHMIAIHLAARITQRLERIGGYVTIEEDSVNVDDRWNVVIKIPMEWAVSNLTAQIGFSFNFYNGFLAGLTI